MKHNIILILIFSLLGSADASTLVVNGNLPLDDTIDFAETPAGLEIVSIVENEITFRMQVIPDNRYLFGFSTSLNNFEWKIEGISLSIEEVEYIDEILGLYRFVPLQDELIGTVTFTEGRPDAAFFKCYTNDFPGDIPPPTGTLP